MAHTRDFDATLAVPPVVDMEIGVRTSSCLFPSRPGVRFLQMRGACVDLIRFSLHPLQLRDRFPFLSMDVLLPSFGDGWSQVCK